MKYSALILAIFILSACSLSGAPTAIINLTAVPTQTNFPTPSLTPTLVPIPTLVPLSNELPGTTIPDGLGVNIHFVRTGADELDLLAEAGFKFVRTDFVWEAVEPFRDVYSFSDYDQLVLSMRERGVRVMFILDYGNPLYDGGLAPHTDDGRAAFARFASAAAEHYAGNGILWELWNEPNLVQFWEPEPNAADYAALAFTTIKAIREVDPNALILGPAICCFEDKRGWDFMEQLGQSGVLKEFDAITIHPYTDKVPETAEGLYLHMQELVEKYSPDKRLPIYAGEWGYSSAWADQNETRQAEYLVRSWLVNLSNNINLSIWYDWKNDCPDPSNAECNFGTVDGDLHPGIPYQAAQTLMHTLDGYSFERRLSTDNTVDYLLVFKKRDEAILVAWTTGAEHTISLPLSGESISIISMPGDTSSLSSSGNGFDVTLTSSPQYLMLGSRTIP